MEQKKMKKQDEPFSGLEEPNPKIRGIVPRKTDETQAPKAEEAEEIADYGAGTHFTGYVEGQIDRTTDFVDEKMKNAAGKSVRALGSAAEKLVAVLRSMGKSDV